MRIRSHFGFGLACLALAWSPGAHAQVPSAGPAGQAEFPGQPPANPAPDRTPAPVTDAAAPLPPAPPAPAPEASAPPAPALGAPSTQESAPPNNSTAAPVKPPLAPQPQATAPPRLGKVFFNVALGGGYFHATSGSRQDLRTFSGGTVSGQLVIGGRLGNRDLTIGGAYLHDEVIRLSSKDKLIDGDEPNLNDVSINLWAIGFFSDVAVRRVPGLHFQGLAGIGGLAVARPGNGDVDDPGGLVFNAGVGYDIAVSEGFALGALLRGTIATFDVDESSHTTVSTFIPALLITGTTR